MSRPPAEAAPADRVRLAEVLVPLSLVTDLGMGQPDEHGARSCLVATALARHMGMAEDLVADTYYAALLQHVGCTATAHEEASHMGGDELLARPLISRTDFGRPAEMITTLRTLGSGHGLLQRGRAVLGAVSGFRWGPDVQRAVCEVAALIATRLGMTEGVTRALSHAFERWDGKGPGGVSGEEIPLAARITHVATRAVAFNAEGGADAAVQSVRHSAGGWLDPGVAATFVECGADILGEVDAASVIDAALVTEARPWRWISPAGLEDLARAFADMADLKSAYTLGHSPGVERLVAGAAGPFGLPEDVSRTARLAALLHDVGRVGVPSGAWERTGPLRAGDWERMRLHPYYTERALARSPVLAEAAAIAGLHHERLDGSGYHRGTRAREIPAAARLLAAADAYQAKTQRRPHRPALTAEQAAAFITEEAKRGALDPDAVAAILDAAGLPRRAPPRERPAGLTDREIEVLRLMGEGCSNRDIAERLVISTRTAEHHVQHIYEKIGLSTRAGAVMFALQHDLIAPPPG